MASKLDFPVNPVKDQVYKFPPFEYKYDGEKWKTVGRGSTPVADAIEAHKVEPEAHTPENVGVKNVGMGGVAVNIREVGITDLNKITTSGHYYTSNAADLNRPSTAAGPIVHIQGTAGYQQYARDNKLMFRGFTGEAFQSWQEIYHTGNKPTATDVGAFASIGDLITTNLNTLNATVNQGMYYQSLDSRATTALNYPITEAGALIVTGSAYNAQQEYTSYNSNRKFVRGKTDVNTWSPWKEIGGPKHHYSGHNMLCTSVPIPSGGNARVYPQVRLSSLGISLDSGHDLVVSKSGKYRIDWGFSIEPTGAIQQGVGSIWKNGTSYIPSLIYNYCPASTDALQLGISSASVILDLLAGDKISLVVQSVNNTTVKIYQSGSIVIQEL